MMIQVNVSLFYHLRQKAGVGSLEIPMPESATILDLKRTLEGQFPSLRTHLDNVMILMNKRIVLDEDRLQAGAEVAFLTPVGGG